MSSVSSSSDMLLALALPFAFDDPEILDVPDLEEEDPALNLEEDEDDVD